MKAVVVVVAVATQLLVDKNHPVMFYGAAGLDDRAHGRQGGHVPLDVAARVVCRGLDERAAVLYVQDTEFHLIFRICAAAKRKKQDWPSELQPQDGRRGRLTCEADGVRKLNGLQNGGVLVHCVHVKDGPGKFPGVRKKRAEPGPRQDRVAHEDPLGRFKHQTGDGTFIRPLSFQLHPKTHTVTDAARAPPTCTQVSTHCSCPLAVLLGVTSSLP